MAKITVNTYWDLVGKDLENLIKWLHKAPMTTRNHYGRYIPILQDLKKQVGLKIGKELMIKAGADKQGVLDAGTILKGTK